MFHKKIFLITDLRKNNLFQIPKINLDQENITFVFVKKISYCFCPDARMRISTETSLNMVIGDNSMILDIEGHPISTCYSYLDTYFSLKSSLLS